ncbi:MAG: hypothetical protein IKP73_03345 [Bacteroidales bacterium]|nr:hypothetical protein [Bacteroidales bacterium]
MSTVLRLLQDTQDPAAQRDNSLRDWQKPVGVAEYNSAYINAIKDPIDASPHSEITSIPSPFARIDLVKSAFKYVSEHDLDGTTIFHKMVSDSLDVGEIFFKYDNFRNRVKIVYWDKNIEIQKLLASNNDGHKILGRTLSTYLTQDANAYNFNQMDGFYLLIYTGSVRGNCVLGATSPRTLFFSVANDLSDLKNDFQFNTDYAFDEFYNPLFKRDIRYVEYLFALRNSYNATNGNNFHKHFQEVDEYLDKTLRRFDGATQQRLNNVTIAADFPNPLQAVINGGINNVQIVRNFNLCKMPQRPITHSDFFINPTRPLPATEKKPLVLPVTTGDIYRGWILSDGNTWNESSNPAPFKDSKLVDDRDLPQTNQHYPYLTIGDFLEDYIIRMPYELNSDAFYNAKSYPTATPQSFFLPLKDLFFKYFTIDDILSKKMIQFIDNQNGTNVEVKLEIPIEQGRKIVYNRIYFANSEPDLKKNRGGIIDKRDNFGFALMPCIKFTNPTDANYRFALATMLSDSSVYNLNFYNSEYNKIDNVQSESVRNTSYEDTPANHIFCICNNNLGYIRLSDSVASGILLPKLKTVTSNTDFTFAIDFGTTNTHIVYKTSADPVVKPLEITEADKQIQLNSNSLSAMLQASIFDNLCPDLVGIGKTTKFPMRSALYVQKGIDWTLPHFALGDSNFAFLYEKKEVYDYNEAITNLKWSNDPHNRKIITSYFESLFFVIRNKVLMNRGRLNTVNIYWTYPMSMGDGRMAMFGQVWQDAYQKYFGGGAGNLHPVNESIAPYKYFVRNRRINDIVTIDIGGGTTDVVYVNKLGNPEYQTSFRFAANSVFGKEIINKFRPDVEQVINNNILFTIKNILDDLTALERPSDIASLFFSLKDNKDVTDKHLDIDFTKILQLNDRQKIVFLIFYCAIIYHIATIMKIKGSKMPEYIGFSGNGSKIIKVLTPSTEILQRLTRRIFEKVYGTSYPGRGPYFETVDNPKEATSIGAIGTPNTPIPNIVLLGTDSNTFADGYTYANIQDNEDVISKLVSQTESFLDFVFDLDNDGISFCNDLCIDQQALATAQAECKERIETFIRITLRERITSTNINSPIEETMFFYALPDVLDSLSGIL